RLRGADGPGEGLALDGQHLRAWLAALGLASLVESSGGRDAAGAYLDFRLRPDAAARCAPGHDTSGLAVALGLDTAGRDRDLDTDILEAILLCPITFELPSHDDLVSAIRLRRCIVLTARRTVLSFHP